MIQEKPRRSKANSKMETEVCAKSVQSPIVVLQRLNIGVNSAALAKETVTDKQSDSVKLDKGQAPCKAGPKSKKPVLRNTSNAASNHLGNEKACSDPIQTVIEPESTLSGLNDGAALSKTKSCKFKKKLKRLDKEPLGMVTDKKLSEKIKEDPKLLTRISASQTNEISKVTVSTRRKVTEKIKTADDEKCAVNNDTKQNNLKANSSQEQVSSKVSLAEELVNNSTVVNDTSAAKETTQVKTSVSTRRRLLRNTEADDSKKSIQADSSLSNISQSVNNELLPHEKELEYIKSSSDFSSVDNNVRKSLSTRTTVRRSKLDDSSVQNSHESSSVEKLVSTIETPKETSNKSSLNEQLVEQEVKEIKSKGVHDNNSSEKTISTRSKLSETKKTDECNQFLVGNETSEPKQSDLKINVSKVQTGRKSLRVEKTQENLKLSADTVSEKETPVKSTISTRNSSQEKTKPDEGNKIKTRRSVIGNKNAQLVQAGSEMNASKIENDSQSSEKKVIESKLRNKIPTRSQLLEKEKVGSDKSNELVQPKKNNSALGSSTMEIDSTSSVSENVDHSTSSSQAEEKLNEKKRTSRRSKILDKNNTTDPEKKITENDTLQSEKSSTTSKSVKEPSKLKENNTKSISTRSKLIEQTKENDSTKLTIEKSSLDIAVQSEPNQNTSPSIKGQNSNELPQSEKSVDNPKRLNPTRTPKKINMQTARSTRSKADKKVTDDLQKPIVEKEMEQIAVCESTPTQSTEQLIPNNTVQDSSRLLTDPSKTKENTPVKSKTREKKKNDGENKTNEVLANSKSYVDCQKTSVDLTKNGETENTVSTRSKLTGKDKGVDLENGALKIIPKSCEAVVDNTSLKTDKVKDSSKQLADLTKSPKKTVTKTTIFTRSKPLEKNEAEIREESIIENGTACIEQNHSIAESTLDADDLHSLTTDTDDSNREISTRSGSVHKTKTDINLKKRKRKSIAEKNESSTKSLAQNKSIVNNKEISPKKDCHEQGQQQVCDKKVVIKLFRCDDTQPLVFSPSKKGTPKKKSPKGKRKAEQEVIVEGTPKSKKSKRLDFNNDSDLPAIDENQSLVADNQVPSNITEDVNRSVLESQNNLESDIQSTEIAENVAEHSENQEVTEKDIQMNSDINIVDNTTTDCVDKSSAVSKKQNQCGKTAETETEIVNISGDNMSVHEVELPEERDEGISVDTSENEANTETFINNDNMVIQESTPVIRDKDKHSSLSRSLVEEVINDWDVADDDKTDDIDSSGVNHDFSTPEVIQIDDNDDVVMIVDTPQEAVTTEKEKNTRKLASHNLNATPRKNVTITSIDISHSPQKQKEKSTTAQEKQCTEKDALASTSEHTSEMSEIEEVDDSNFESVDENSCTEVFANENDQEENVSQETITYYNSEDISMDVGVAANDNRLNDVVMNLKAACDKITADLSTVNASYANNQETSNRQEPELLCISDDSSDEQEQVQEEEEEVMIIEPLLPPPLIERPETPLAEQRSLMISNQIRQALQGTPSISVIKASELLQAPADYPIKPTEQHVVYSQRQMHSTTLLPASFVTDPIDVQTSPLFTEDTIMKCPKCRCEFVGKSRLRRHWLTCGDAMYLHCPFCPCKVKHRRSLVNHLNAQHAESVSSDDAARIAEQVVKQTREAAGVKLKQGCHRAVRDFLQTSFNVPIIQLPPFIRIQCVVCSKNYNEIPATYKKTCDNCSSDLMTAICDLCSKQYMLSSKIGLHVQGNCIYNGRIQCRECDFVASGRYNLQEHIVRKHIFVAPEDYLVCGLGCGKTYRSHEALRKHERICGKEANLDCRFCDYKTKHRSAMKLHVQQHIVNEKLTINNDGTVKLFGQPTENESDDDVRDLITEQQVRSVIRVHCSRCKRNLRLTSNRSSCEFCKLSFTFSCSRCSDTIRLDSLHSARLHVIRSHSVKIHECPQCLEKFSYVYDLTRHASKCTANVMMCCEYCTYRTNQEAKLRDHKRRLHFKSQNYPYSCKKCNKPFQRIDSMRRHEKMNCGVQPNFSCEHCQFKTKTKFSLLRHIQTQHAYIYENFSFVCDRCNNFYTNMFSYEEHVKNCHALASN